MARLVHKRRARSQLKKADVQRFESFLLEMQAVLDVFIEEARTGGVDLNFSIESLDALEAHLVGLRGATVTDADLLLRNRAARYLGEVFRRNLGGHWALCDGGPRYLFHGLPVIVGYATVDIEFCPTEMIGNTIARSAPGTLRRIVGSHREWLRP